MAYGKIIILYSGGIKFESSLVIKNKIRYNPYSGFELGRRLPPLKGDPILLSLLLVWVPNTFQIGLLVSHWLEIKIFGNVQIGFAGNFFFSKEV